MSAKLSAHFAVSEFHCRDGAQTPMSAGRELRALAASYLEPLREHFGPVTITSGYRTPAYNRRVGGATASFHLYGLSPGRGVAADITCRRGTPKAWAAFLETLDPGGLGIYPGFVHVDTRRGRSRWAG